VYRIEYERSAQKELATLSRSLQRGIVDAIGRLGDDPRPAGCRKIAGTENGYRIRVGRYRVVYGIRDEALVVVIRVAKRDERTYRSL
jgi:mRNA interferase RelE/StbE